MIGEIRAEVSSADCRTTTTMPQKRTPRPHARRSRSLPPMPASQKRVVLTLTCIDAPSVIVSFEPEGAVHTLRRDDWFRVEIVGPDEGDVEVSYLPDGLVVGAWSGARTHVWNKAGVELKT
jgi:hypothetical protein